MKGERTMTAKQISVFLENRPGKLAEFVDLLRGSGIDMRALSLAEAADFGVLRTIVSDPDKAQRVLAEAGFISAVTPVLAVAVSDEPGALYRILEILRDAEINLEYSYAFTTRRNQGAYMVFRVADDCIPRAAELLAQNGIEVIAQEEIYGL